jgi:hypothetical protein
LVFYSDFPDLLKLDESQHSVDSALVVVELEDAVGDDCVDVGTENKEFFSFFHLNLPSVFNFYC